MKQIVFISGPMTGIKDFNYPAFHRAEVMLRYCGNEVINPAVTCEVDTEHIEDPCWHDYMVSSIMRMKGATAIHFLPGWWWSYGAWVEKIVSLKMKLERIV